MTTHQSIFRVIVAFCLCFILSFPAFAVVGNNSNKQKTVLAQYSAAASIQYLAQAMDQYHDRFPVYEDVSSAGNHFHTYTKIPGENAPVEINGSITDNPHSGATAIRAKFQAGSGPYGGYYFQNGVLRSGQTNPVPNFGTEPNAGITELANATAVTFWARGETGGEKVDFFAGGVGRNPESPGGMTVLNPCTPEFPGKCPHPDSSGRRPAFGNFFTLTTNWQRFTIDLQGADFSYVLGGFGWVASIDRNPNGATFYIDDIQYELSPASRAQRLNQPRFIRSYLTGPYQSEPPPVGDFDLVLRNSAYIYDNALALLAFLADGSKDSLRRARLIGDALVYAGQHDRYYTDGRLRNAYSAGDIALPPGWTPNGQAGTVPTPGFYREDPPGFIEIEQENIDTGNNAWAMIALLGLYRRTSQPQYLNAALNLGQFIKTFRNNAGTYRGFLGGLANYPENPKTVTPRVYASSEHNIDIYAAFTSAFQITGDTQWQTNAEHAREFVEAMWDPARGCYLTGTIDPSTRNTTAGQLPVDVQLWSVLALPNTLQLHPGLLDRAKQNHRTIHHGFAGFDFNEDKDGVWFEGTGQGAVAYAKAGQSDFAETLRLSLRRAQRTSIFGSGGGIVAACHNGLSTGFGFKYFRRVHTGATAWNVFAQLGFNPYYQQVSL